MDKKVIAIGALGGSGTRAVAKIVKESGVFIGDELNGPLDNLIFTRLFKNPKWNKKAAISDINFRLSVFEKYMKGEKLDFGSFYELLKVAKSNKLSPSRYNFYFNVLKRRAILEKPRDVWGWKEPNTQFYIKEVLDYFPDLKYIHVIRNGLDMAFSTNKQQLHNWHWKFNIDKDFKNKESFNQLNLWIRSTKKVIKIAQEEKYKNRILILNHTALCDNPKEEIDRIIDFCGIPLSQEKLNKLYEIPGDKGSNDRYKNYDLSIFDSEQLKFVESMGFNLNYKK